MPTITVTVEVALPKGRLRLSKLERDVHRAAMAAGRKALVEALGVLEQRILEQAGARQRRVRRYLLTRLGPIRFYRWKTKKDGRYLFPLDRAIGLEPWQSCSAWVFQQACQLATEHPYRTAAKRLRELLGVPVDHRVVWALVQKAGRARRDRRSRDRAEMFDEGIAPPETDPVEMVVVEVDGVMLRHQRGGKFEAKVAAAYTGKRLVSHAARHRKLACTGKVLEAGVFLEGETGQVLYSSLCRSVHIHRARHTLVSGDGAAWIPVMVRNWFPDAHYQLDHYHLKAKLSAAAAGDRHLASRWISWALSGRFSTVARSMARAVRHGRLDEGVAQDALSYLEINRGAIWAFKELVRNGAPPELCTRGSGVIEHNIDLLVARRMKRQGMRWSREGAHNLLVLRALAMDEGGWQRWWEGVVA